MRWFAWIVLSLLVVIVAVLVMDAMGRLLVLKDKTEYRIVRSTTSDSRRLFVYYPGILADGEKSSLNLLSTWTRYGDVMLVSYRGDRFIADEAVRTVVTGIQHYAADYDEIVFIGSSMGGMLSYDTAMVLKDELSDMPLAFVLVDAPTKRSDLQSPLDKISLLAKVVGGPITNLFSRTYFNLTFVPPKDENIEPGVDRDELAKRVDEAKSFPLSTNNDWVRYILAHGQMKDAFDRGVYIRSRRDNDTVRPEAYNSWNPVFGGMLRRIEVDSTHVGYNERPRAWQDAFPRAFAEIGIR